MAIFLKVWKRNKFIIFIGYLYSQQHLPKFPLKDPMVAALTPERKKRSKIIVGGH
jgi:hypothetical protein